MPAWVRTVALVAVLALPAADLVLAVKRPRAPSLRESSAVVASCVGLAVLFGLGVLATAGGRFAGEFFAGWITKYVHLSVDNSRHNQGRFAVPRAYQQTVVVGNVVALTAFGSGTPRPRGVGCLRISRGAGVQLAQR